MLGVGASTPTMDSIYTILQALVVVQRNLASQLSEGYNAFNRKAAALAADIRDKTEQLARLSAVATQDQDGPGNAGAAAPADA